MNSHLVAQYLENLLVPNQMQLTIASLVDRCITFYFEGISKEILGDAIQLLQCSYPDYETELEDTLDWVLGSGSAWFHFPFTCVPAGFDFETGELL